MPDGVARSAGECSCTFLYLDSVFVESEDLFDRTVVFPSPKSYSSMELGSRREGSGRGIWLLSATLNRWDLNRALPHPQPRCPSLGSGPRTQTMGSAGSFSGLAFPGQDAPSSSHHPAPFLQAQKREMGRGKRKPFTLEN